MNADLMKGKNTSAWSLTGRQATLPLFMGIVNHLDTNTDHDGMTFMDRAKLCSERLDHLFEKLQPYIDEDGVFIEGSIAENLYRRARKICMRADLQKMDEIEKEAECLLAEYNIHKTLLINGGH